MIGRVIDMISYLHGSGNNLHSLPRKSWSKKENVPAMKNLLQDCEAIL